MPKASCGIVVMSRETMKDARQLCIRRFCYRRGKSRSTDLGHIDVTRAFAELARSRSNTDLELTNAVLAPEHAR